MRNLKEQVKKAFCYQKLFWTFTVWINCSNDLKNSRPSVSNFKSFSRKLEQFFLTVGQNNFYNKIQILPFSFGEIQELCCNCSENEAFLVFDLVLPVVCIRIKPLIKLEGPLHFWGPLLAHLFSGLDLSVNKEEEKKIKFKCNSSFFLSLTRGKKNI